VRSIARLLAAISLVASAGIAAHAAPAAPPPSVFEERGPASTSGATSSDPTLRQRPAEQSAETQRLFKEMKRREF